MSIALDPIFTSPSRMTSHLGRGLEVSSLEGWAESTCASTGVGNPTQSRWRVR